MGVGAADVVAVLWPVAKALLLLPSTLSLDEAGERASNGRLSVSWLGSAILLYKRRVDLTRERGSEGREGRRAKSPSRARPAITLASVQGTMKIEIKVYAGISLHEGPLCTRLAAVVTPLHRKLSRAPGEDRTLGRCLLKSRPRVFRIHTG